MDFLTIPPKSSDSNSSKRVEILDWELVSNQDQPTRFGRSTIKGDWLAKKDIYLNG